MKARRWQYFVWRIPAPYTSPFTEFEGKFDSWEEWVSFRLNANGKDGWEAVSVWTQPGKAGNMEAFVLLKRDKTAR